MTKAKSAKENHVQVSNVLMLGITFKENCPDIRNTKAIDVYSHLCDFDLNGLNASSFVFPNLEFEKNEFPRKLRQNEKEDPSMRID